MRYRDGGVGHKSTQEETDRFLDDRDKLDKVPFELESERNWEYDNGSDVEMRSGARDADDGEMEDVGNEESDGIDDDESNGDEEIDRDEESDGDDEPELERNSMALVDEELLDEMDEFGYSGLDQVEEDDEEWEDSHLGQDALSAEDGENVDWEGEEDDLAHAYL